MLIILLATTANKHPLKIQWEQNERKKNEHTHRNCHSWNKNYNNVYSKRGIISSVLFYFSTVPADIRLTLICKWMPCWVFVILFAVVLFFFLSWNPSIRNKAEQIVYIRKMWMQMQMHDYYQFETHVTDSYDRQTR